MNCEEFRENWSEWHAGRLDGATATRMAEQRAACADCARYDRQMRQLVDSLAELPLPDALPAEPKLTDIAAMKPRPRRRIAPAWLAVAATVVIAFGAGVLTHAMLIAGAGESEPTMAGAVEAQPGTTREIQLAVTSPRSIERVEFEIELPAEVELEGHPGQRVVRWQGRLAEGRSRLTLPLRIGAADEGAEVLARIRHADGEREIRVPLEARSGENGSA
jgi:ferric-dicitrate binding protein FerR (iron transport regulator)